MTVARNSWASEEGLPYPLGVSWISEERAFNFALYTKHATSVRLLLYAENNTETPRLALSLDPFKQKSGRIWHCRVKESLVRGCTYYAYAIDGPQAVPPFEVHAFHPEKILLDPYARSIFVPEAFDRSLALGNHLNAGRALLGMIPVCESAREGNVQRRPYHESDAVLYELHVRGFTRHPSCDVTPDLRGTFAGVVEKIPYLRDLGINAVELMPIFQFDPQARDFWGYMPLSFFATHRGYARDPAQAINEFRSMVSALHEADIEVVIDVVYNHTAEAGTSGPVYSYKGIDNSTYYLIKDAEYADFSGTGNSLNCTNRYVRKMILDSMRYWVREMHVDGFRFDLASVFTRNADGSINFDDPPIIGEISSDPDFDGIRMIAEPWDAVGAYELGRSFPGIAWLQWNGRFRDDVRRFVRGDANMVGLLMQRLYGSDDLFPDDPLNAYHAYQSVNYVTCHDGFTLYDLVSYNRKRNEANGHGNADGPEENFSWNCGWEGDIQAPAEVLALRERQAKNLIALLLLSNGTPMLRAGDEFLSTQAGNNNPYNQDNETTWLDWTGLRRHAGFFRFVKELIAFRKAHPSLGRSRFWRDDAQWFGSRGLVDLSPESRNVAVLLRGASQADDDLYIMVNAAAESVRMTIQGVAGPAWRRHIDTAQSSPNDISAAGRELDEAHFYPMAPRSVVVLSRRRAPGA